MFRFFNKKLVVEDNDIVAMIESTMFNIKDVNDEVFASKTMGNGV